MFLKNSRFSMLLRVLKSNFCSIEVNRKLTNENILFVHIPKTAGRSIIKAKQENFKMQKLKRQIHHFTFPNKGVVTFSHVSYFNLLEIGAVSRKFHLNAYKFCFVRNPYHRVVSLFNFLKQESIVSNKIEFEAFLDKVMLYRPPVGLYNYRGISQSNPQADWIVDHNDNFLVDDIFKVEQLEKFKTFIFKKYKKNLNIEKINASKSKFSIEDLSLNKSAIEKIKLIYHRDFRLFGYSTSLEV